jgi:streptomycin 6-kinase
MPLLPLATRVKTLVRDWNITVRDTRETTTSFLAFGTRGTLPVVLKVVRQPGDEWRSGAIVAAFDGHGMVRAYDYTQGAILLERLTPGSSLADLALTGRDDEATEILADVIHRMAAPQLPLTSSPTVGEWALGFQRYIESGDTQIPRDIIERAQHVYLRLNASQQSTRLLHGDLQHYNVLSDASRGWLAIDPKGVVGEIEYEIGASLRNPSERPDLFISSTTVARRLALYGARLPIAVDRALAWAFAQAVLSAVWGVEDGATNEANGPSLQLAAAIGPMLTA